MRNAVDFSYARPSGQELADKELDALVYTGNARPDWAYVDDLRSHGVIVTFIQETTSTRSQQGFAAGVADCLYAESRAKELGHTGSIAVVVSDGSWVDAWDCSEYGRGWNSVATLPYFSYGSTGCCESFNRGAGRSLGTWIPETWGKGSLMSQHVGSSPIADTDLNYVHADYTGIAVTPIDDEDDLIEYWRNPGNTTEIWLVENRMWRRHVGSIEWGLVNTFEPTKAAGLKTPPSEMWNATKDITTVTGGSSSSFTVTSTVKPA